MTINDAIHAALGPGQINDLLLAYYQANGATANDINDAEYEFLVARGADTLRLNDMWYWFLREQGYTGTVNDMKLQWWKDGGVVVPNATSVSFTAPNFVSAPDNTAGSFLSILDIRALIQPNQWAAGVQHIVSKWDVGTTNGQSWMFSLNATGALQINASVDGVANLTANSVAPVVPPASGPLWVRVAYNNTNRFVNFYQSDNGIDWVNVGAPNIPFDLASFFDNAVPILIGGRNNAGTFNGEILRVAISDTILGEPYFDFYPKRDVTDGSQPSWTSGSLAGEVWTLNGASYSEIEWPTIYLTFNQSWQGMSGSVGGADLTFPTGWDVGFWPPDDCITVSAFPNNEGAFLASLNRGYFTQTRDVSLFIGEEVNLSAYISNLVEGTNRALSITGNASAIGGQPPLVEGRISGRYLIIGPEIQIRSGVGVTSNANSNYQLGRVQLTLGSELLPFVPDNV